MTVILFDGKAHHTLKPFTWTRPVADMRLGMFTLAEKWSHFTQLSIGFLTQPYLQEKFSIGDVSEIYVYISGNVWPDASLLDEILVLEEQEVLLNKNHEILAFKSRILLQEVQFEKYIRDFYEKTYLHEIVQLSYPEQFIQLNAEAIAKDFEYLSSVYSSHALSETNTILGHQIFISPGVKAECCTFNTLTGPIIIGENAQILEGSHLRGPIAIGTDAALKMGSKVYGGTTIGPSCTVGGEVKNSIFWGYSNKGHDGYVGDAIIGQWCNLGAGTSNSNMKNNMKSISLWDYSERGYRDTKMQFCGLMMGDFSMTAIHTAFNTGTVVGVAVNVLSEGLTDKFIPDFTWGNTEYQLEKALETLEVLWNRKKIELDSLNKLIFSHIFRETKEFRN